MEKSIRSKIIATALVVVLCLSAVAAVFFMPNKIKSARGATGSGLRFSQVALGDNFAIGLSYDKELYGWNLDGTGANSLGVNYGTNPTKIPVEFADADDEIVKIAATRKSAAFITKRNRIYTWGTNSLSGANGYGILLREVQSNDAIKPTPISTSGSMAAVASMGIGVDFRFGNTTLDDASSLSGSRIVSDDNQLLDIVGSDYNYIVKHIRRSAQGNVVAYFGWGSNKYITTGTSASDDNLAAYMYGYNEVSNSSTNDNPNVVLGGGTAVIASGDELLVRGKNYYIPTLPEGTTEYIYEVGKTNNIESEENDVYGVLYFDNIFDLYTSDSAQNNGSGEYGRYTLTQTELLLPMDVNGAQIDGVTYSGGYVVNEAIAGKDLATSRSGSFDFFSVDKNNAQSLQLSYTPAQFINVAGQDPINVKLPALSMGNGYGYLIRDSRLFFAGNGYNGQSGTSTAASYGKLTAVTGFEGTPITVAAGKTLQGDPLFSAVRNTNYLSKGGVLSLANADGGKYAVTVNGGEELAQYADGVEFLSGLVTSRNNGDNYSVYVWNKDKTFTSIDKQLSEKGVTGASGNHIVSLGGGYGNNLVALSSLGKIYQISFDADSDEFKVELKDKFLDDSGNILSNYTVNDNPIGFAVSNGRPFDNSVQKKEIKATLSLNSLVGSKNNIEDATVLTSATFTPVVSDFSGDYYRILTDEDGVDSVSGSDTYLSGRTIVSGVLVNRSSESVPSTGKPKFYFESRVGNARSELSAEILAHYLDYEFIYDSNGNVSIEITPYQSTQGGAIIMEYYIARCMGEEALKESLPTGRSGNNGKMLDISVATARITVANTEASFDKFSYLLYGDASDISNDSNVSIPLLDPNNPKNNVYSIALTNSQFGLTKLAQYFGVTEQSALDAFNAYVVSKAYEVDSGFPAKKRVADAGLARYFADSESDVNFKSQSYYTDIYQYIAFDPDGDALAFNRNNFSAYNQAGNYFSYAVQPISFEIPLNGEGFTLTGLTQDTLLNFNNIYGLTLEVDDANGVLTVSYDVLQVKATASSLTVEYKDNDIRKAVMPYSATIPTISLAVEETYYVGNTANVNSNIDNTDNAVYVPVYVQASMIMKNTEYSSEVGHNIYHVAPKNLTVGADSENLRIYTFDLSAEALFTDSTNIYMSFAKVGENGTTSYRNFSDFCKQFDSRLVNVTLNEARFTFESKVPEVYSDIMIELRRFTNSNMSQPILTADASGNVVDAEVITLVFDITASESSFSRNGISQLSRQTVNQYTEIDISSFTSARDTAFVSWRSSNDSTATVRASADGKKLLITPISSGSIVVSFTIQQYQVTKKGSFTVDVESRSILNRTISLVESSTVYLADFKGAIAQNYSGTFDFDSYVLDTASDPANAPDGYYFVKKSIDDSGAEVWVTDSRPSFIGNINIIKDRAGSIDSSNAKDNAIVLTLNPEYRSTVDEGEYRLVVKFTDDLGSDTGKKFEAAVSVTPAKKYLRLDGSELLIDVNTVHKNVQSPESGPGRASEDGKEFRIALSSIIGYTTWPEDFDTSKFNVKLVVPVSDLSYDYFDLYSVSDDIVIVPIKNTSERQQVNVVVSNNEVSYTLTFYVSINGIVEVLSKNVYVTIWLVVAACVFVVLFIIFLIRMGVYWKRKAEQKRIIRKNQMLIKMRDKMHGKSDSVSKEQLVQTKLKLEDPKYAKMFNDMKRASEENSITLDDDGSKKSKSKKDKKGKKSGKKSLAELKAELEAKREAMAKMQMGGEVPMDDMPVDAAYGSPLEPDFGSFESVVPNDVVTGDTMADSMSADENVLFDVETLDDDK